MSHLYATWSGGCRIEYYGETHFWKPYRIRGQGHSTGPLEKKGYNYALVAKLGRFGELIFDQRTQIAKSRLPYSKRFYQAEISPPIRKRHARRKRTAD